MAVWRSALVTELPFVGRGEELAFVAATLEARGAVLGGSAGVGKTRLARAALAGTDGIYVAWAAATPGAADLPLGGLAVLGLDDDLFEVDARPGLLARLTSALVERAEGKRVVLAVDDAHLLDELSAAFVHHLVTTDRAAALLTLRTNEPAPAAIVALYKERLLPRLEVQPLARDEVDALVAVALGGDVDGVTAKRLWDATGGNALFLRELLADALDTGVLEERGGQWTWTGDGVAGPRLMELVADRIGRLDGEARELAQLLAVGEPLGVALVEHLVPGVDLIVASERGLIAVEESDRRAQVRLAHPLFGEVIRAGLGVLERRRAERRLADALEESGLRRGGDVLRAAAWRLSSGSATDPVLLVAGARRAQRTFDHELAAKLARASLDMAASVDAAVTLAAALDELGRFDEANEVLQPLVGREADDAERIALAAQRVWTAFRGGAPLDHVRQVFQSAEGSIADPVGKLFLRARLVLPLAVDGRWEEAIDIGEPLVRDGVDDRVRLRAFTAVSAALGIVGRGDDALALCEALTPIADRLRDEFPGAEAGIASARATALILTGRVDDAAELLAPVAEANISSRLPRGDAAHGLAKLGRVCVTQGRPRSALVCLEPAAVTLRENDPYRILAMCLANSAEASALLGDLAAATVLADEARDKSDGKAYSGDVGRSLAWVAAAAGERSRAIEELTQAAADQEARGQPVHALWSLHDALRLGAHDVAAPLEQLASAVAGPWAVAAAAHARAVHTGEAHLFDEAAGAFAALGAHLIAAEIASEAGSRWAAESLPARASAARRAVRTHLRSCEVTSSPAMVDRAAAEPLTWREQEVADLAGQGLTNAESAVRRTLSIRTIESHLYAIYAKLGITSRADLL